MTNSNLGDTLKKARKALPKRSRMVGVSVPMELYTPMMERLNAEGIEKPQSLLLFLLMSYMKENNWVDESVLKNFQND